MNKPYFDIITVPYSLELQYFDKFTYLSPTPLETSTPAWLTVSFCLFFIGLAGMAFNYKNFLVTMMCVEIMYLGAVTSFVFYGLAFHDITAAIYGLLILIFAACESAVGLGLLISVYRLGRTIGFSTLIYSNSPVFIGTAPWGAVSSRQQSIEVCVLMLSGACCAVVGSVLNHTRLRTVSAAKCATSSADQIHKDLPTLLEHQRMQLEQLQHTTALAKQSFEDTRCLVLLLLVITILLLATVFFQQRCIVKERALWGAGTSRRSAIEPTGFLLAYLLTVAAMSAQAIILSSRASRAALEATRAADRATALDRKFRELLEQQATQLKVEHEKLLLIQEGIANMRVLALILTTIIMFLLVILLSQSGEMFRRGVSPAAKGAPDTRSANFSALVLLVVGGSESSSNGNHVLLAVIVGCAAVFGGLYLYQPYKNDVASAVTKSLGRQNRRYSDYVSGEGNLRRGPDPTFRPKSFPDVEPGLIDHAEPFPAHAPSGLPTSSGTDCVVICELSLFSDHGGGACSFTAIAT